MTQNKSKIELERELTHLRDDVIESLRKTEGKGKYDSPEAYAEAKAAWEKDWYAAHDRVREITFELAKEFGPEPTEESAARLIIQTLVNQLESANQLFHGWYSEPTARAVIELEYALDLATDKLGDLIPEQTTAARRPE